MRLEKALIAEKNFKLSRNSCGKELSKKEKIMRMFSGHFNKFYATAMAAVKAYKRTIDEIGNFYYKTVVHYYGPQYIEAREKYKTAIIKACTNYLDNTAKVVHFTIGSSISFDAYVGEPKLFIK